MQSAGGGSRTLAQTAALRCKLALGGLEFNKLSLALPAVAP